MSDLSIMRTIALEPMHGWAIAQRIQQISDEAGRRPLAIEISKWDRLWAGVTLVLQRP